jgi:NitT/TauT family transport system ATP-binding protein
MTSSNDIKTVLSVESLSKAYPSRGENSLKVIDNLSLSLAGEEMLAIVGPSGCGKTTLLRIMGGLLNPTSGMVSVMGEEVTSPRRDVVMIFQDYARSLFPWRTVRQNVAFGLESIGYRDSKMGDYVEEHLAMVGLSEFADHLPWRLSGGMQQRVAIARALIRDPALLLMDEPLGSLDAQTRYGLEDEIRTLAHKKGASVVLVTHDIDEAVYMSNRILILSKRPAHAIGVVKVTLPKNRKQSETRSSHEFGKIRGEVFSKLDMEGS